MQITAGESSDRAAQNERQNGERDGQSIEQKLQVEVKMLFWNQEPVSEFNDDMPRIKSQHQEEN